MKFKVGDTVRIKNSLIVGQKYNDYVFNKDMEKYKWLTSTIKHVYTSSYTIDIDNGRFSWTEDMLKPYKDYRELLQTGVFGEMSNGKIFVVVNDLLVYNTGGYDRINNLDESLYFSNNVHVVKAVKDCESFDIYKEYYRGDEGGNNVIYYNNILEITETSLRYAFTIDELKELYETKTGRKVVIKE